MKFNRLYVVFSFALVIVGCSGDGQYIESLLPRIDVNKEYPVKEIFLQDVADIEYIPLETNENMLFQGTIAAVSDKGMLGMSQQEGKLFLFDRSGKAKNFICRKGDGPEEYNDIQNVDVDWQRGEIYVLGAPSKVYVYTLDGTYKRTLDTKVNIRQRDMLNYSADKLVLFKEKANVGKEGEITAYHPVMLLDKSGKTIDSLQYVKDWEASLSIRIDGNENWKAYLYCEVMLGQGGETYLNDMASDTVYQINKKTNELFPILLRTPSVRDSEGGKYYLRLEGVTSRYYFLKCQISSLNMKGMVIKDDKSYSLVYDRQTGEIFRPTFRNKDFPSEEWSYMMRSNGEKDCVYQKLESFALKEALEEGQLEGSLKTVAQGLDEDDNPVIMVVRFR